jgi:hypothetical protein
VPSSYISAFVGGCGGKRVLLRNREPKREYPSWFGCFRPLRSSFLAALIRALSAVRRVDRVAHGAAEQSRGYARVVELSSGGATQAPRRPRQSGPRSRAEQIRTDLHGNTRQALAIVGDDSGAAPLALLFMAARPTAPLRYAVGYPVGAPPALAASLSRENWKYETNDCFFRPLRKVHTSECGLVNTGHAYQPVFGAELPHS